MSSIDPTNNIAGDIFEEIVGDTLDSIESNLTHIIDENLNTSAVRGEWHEWFWDNRNEIKSAIMDKIKIDL
jgi:hypothetical protein